MAILGHSKQQFHREPTPLNRCYSINHQAPALQLGALTSLNNYCSGAGAPRHDQRRSFYVVTVVDSRYLEMDVVREREGSLNGSEVANPKTAGTRCFDRYEAYKGSINLNDALAQGARSADFRHDLDHGFLTLLAPPVDRVLGPLPGNEGEVVYDHG